MELRQVPDGPNVVMEEVMSLFPTDLCPIQSESTHFGVFLVCEFDPSLCVPLLVVSTRLFPCASHALQLRLKVYSLDLKPLSQHFSQVVRVHVGRNRWEIAYTLVLRISKLDLRSIIFLA